MKTRVESRETRVRGRNEPPSLALDSCPSSLGSWKSSGRMRSLSRKQVAADSRLWVRVPRLPLTSDGEQRLAQRTGSWSNSKTPVLQTGDPGATPGESNEGRERRVERQEPEEVANHFSGSRLLSLVPRLFRFRGPAATTPGLHPENDGSSPSGISV